MIRMTISLPDDLKAFVDGEVAANRSGSASDYITFLVQMARVRQHQERVEQLLVEGLNSGPATPMKEREWASIRQKIENRLSRAKKPRRKSRPA